MTTISQRNFSSGELTPALHSRVDLTKYHSGLKTCRNMLVLRHGGIVNRPGTKFIANTKFQNRKVRLIEFVFSKEDTYMLEFGHFYIRFFRDGEVVRTGANPGIVDSGDISEIRSPYREEHLKDLNVAQSGDILLVCHPFFHPKELQRNDDGWRLVDSIVRPEIEGPMNVRWDHSYGPEVPDIVHGSYAVTAIDEDTLSESFVGTNRPEGANLGGDIQHTVDISNPIKVYWDRVDGAREYNVYRITSGVFNLLGITTGTSLNDIGQPTDGTFTPPTDKSVFGEEFLSIDNINRFGNVVTVTDSTEDIEKLLGGASGTSFIGVISDISLARSTNQHFFIEGIPVRFTLVPVSNTDKSRFDIEVSTVIDGRSITQLIDDDNIVNGDLFTGGRIYKLGEFPSTVSFFQQRLYFASSINRPSRVWASRVGRYRDFTTRRNTQDDDSLDFEIAGRRVERVNHIFGLEDLAIITDSGELTIRGGDLGITPTNINVRNESYFGASIDVNPVIVGRSAIYVQNGNEIVRDFRYDFSSGGYQGNDLTIFSSHLFDGHRITDIGYQKAPNSTLWVSREDGKFLCLTYINEQQIVAWTRCDFEKGKAISINTIPEENNIERIYFAVERDGVITIERMADRTRESVFLDSAVEFIGGEGIGARIIRYEDGTYFVTPVDTNSVHLSVFRQRKENVRLKITFVSGDYIVFDDKMNDGTSLVFRKATAFQSDGTEVGSTRDNITFLLSRDRNPWSQQVSATDNVYNDAKWEFFTNAPMPTPHLDGQLIGVYADGHVLASPNNFSYPSIFAGSIGQFDRYYSYIVAGLPITSDIETLDIDSAESPKLKVNKKLINNVRIDVLETRGLFAGDKAPPGNGIQGLTEFKLRQYENYDKPVQLKSGSIEVNIQAGWNSNGSIFIRQVDPLPLTISNITPSGYIPTGGR